MTEKYHSKEPRPQHFTAGNVMPDKQCFRHSKTIVEGDAVVFYVPEKGAWLAPGGALIYSRTAANTLAHKIAAILAGA
jgi:hypothetical protein